MILPNQIWVTNLKAYKLARNVFRNKKIYIKQNLYETNLIKKLAKLA